MSFWISVGNAFSARTVFLCLLARAKAARILVRLSNIGSSMQQQSAASSPLLHRLCNRSIARQR